MNSKMGFNTNVGIKKSINQDSLLIKKASTSAGEIILIAVCDGMGGLKKGELASATVVRTFSEWFENELPNMLGNFSFDMIKASWDKLLRQQNDKLMNYGNDNQTQLGTTISMMLIMENGQYMIAHVGDTRVYCIDSNGITQITEDHTVVALDLKKGKITPDQAKVDPRRNVLLQCVGVNGQIDPDYYEGIAKSGECYLICSDGFRHKVSDEEIDGTIKAAGLDTENEISDKLAELVSLNMNRGETDNISAILCRFI